MNRKPYRHDPASAPSVRDAPEVLPGLPDGPAGCIITSPPCRGKRDYGVTGQYRREPGPGSCAATLRAVLAQARRVLAGDGTCPAEPRPLLLRRREIRHRQARLPRPAPDRPQGARDTREEPARHAAEPGWMTRRPRPAPSRPDTEGKPRRAPPWTLTDEDRAAIRAAVAALPPLTDEQVDALCDVIIAARKRWQREDAARAGQGKC